MGKQPKRRAPRTPRRPDLNQILAQVVAEYWPQYRTLPVIVWVYPTRATKSDCTLGYYKPDLRYIHITEAVAGPWVPGYVVKYLVYHEFCHWLQDQLPVPNEPIHSDRFMEWESHLTENAKAQRWIYDHIDLLINETNRLVKLRGYIRPPVAEDPTAV
jgi:hypothetical protein